MNLGAFDQAKRITALEVAERYAGIKPIRKGKKYICCCVFHNEKHPSLTFNTENGLFHCFGCHAGGSSIDFVMAFFHIDKHSAVEKIIDDFYHGAVEELPRAGDIVTYRDIQNAVSRARGTISSYLHYIDDQLAEMKMEDDLDAELLLAREKYERLLDEVLEQNDVIDQLRILMPYQEQIVKLHSFLDHLPDDGKKRYLGGVLNNE